jgi:hypothetical protein
MICLPVTYYARKDFNHAMLPISFTASEHHNRQQIGRAYPLCRFVLEVCRLRSGRGNAPGLDCV